MAISAYALTSLDWLNHLLNRGLSPHLLPYWTDGLYKNKNSWQRHIASSLVADFQNEFDFSLPRITHIQEAQDGTVKFQMCMADSLEVETVLIPFHKRYTICLSTQVGCAMNCHFCYTGTQGLKRNLTAGEIVGQYLSAHRWLLNHQETKLKPSVVFMGQGEPLHNGYEVQKAILVLNDPKLVGLGQSQITLSTVGYLPGFKFLKELPRINIALSLHSPFQGEREALIPISKTNNLDAVMESLDQLEDRIITYEYLLIKDLNMSQEHVRALSALLSHRRAVLNLIPFNPFPGSNWERPTDLDIDEFRSHLVASKLRVMVRTTKGDDILAACGQLKINKMTRTHAIQT